MEPTKIIFLLGLSRSGKDTVGQMLADKGYTRVAFADSLKEEYAKTNGIDVSVLQIQGPEKEKHRGGLIELAEDRKKINPNHWLEAAFKPYLTEEGFFKEGLKLVVTDFRRINEIEWILERKKEIYEVNMQNLLHNSPCCGVSMNDESTCVDCGKDITPEEMVKHYLDMKIIYINRPGNEDTDVLTHHTIGFSFGLQKGNLPFQVVDATIINDKTLEILQQKVINCMNSLGL